METVLGISAASDYTGTTRKIPDGNYITASITAQIKYKNIGAAITMKMQHSVDGVSFDFLRNEDGVAYSLATGTGAGVRILTFYNIHGTYFRLFVDKGSNTTGTFDLHVIDGAMVMAPHNDQVKVAKL